MRNFWVLLFIVVLQFLIIVPYVYSCMVDWHTSSLWSSQTIIVEPSYFDWLYVEVRANGDVVCQLTCRFVDAPFYYPPLPGLGVSSCGYGLYYVVGDPITFGIRIDLHYMSEADAHANKIRGLCEDWLSVNFKETKRVLETFNDPQFGILRSMYYEFVCENFNPDAIIDKFLALLPKNGFMSLISRKVISKNDKFWLQFYFGSKYCKFIYAKEFIGYFNFKVGETYTLDIFKLFDFPGPLKIHEKSINGSCVEIHILSYGYGTEKIYTNIKAEIINVEFPFRYRIRGAQTYTIDNDIPQYAAPTKYTLTAGDVVDYMRITFKIVEEGYGIKFESINVAGILIVLISVFIVAVIVWRFKRYRSSLTHQPPFNLK